SAGCAATHWRCCFWSCSCIAHPAARSSFPCCRSTGRSTLCRFPTFELVEILLCRVDHGLYHGLRVGILLLLVHFLEYLKQDFHVLYLFAGLPSRCAGTATIRGRWRWLLAFHARGCRIETWRPWTATGFGLIVGHD